MNNLGRLAFLLLLAAAPAAATAEDPACRDDSFAETAFTVCRFDLASDDLRMFWRPAEGEPYGTFDALSQALAARNLALTVAVNGGMYDEDFTPIGLYIENGVRLKPANTIQLSPDIKPVPNFYKQPNGIFLVAGKVPRVMTTAAYLEEKPAADFATQSGPMLVIDGVINPIFIVGSTDRKRRNGVGVAGSEAYLVIADDAVNFHDFARFFKERLGVDNALFLDGGSAPALYAPDLGRDDPPGHGGFGPIIGVVEKKP